MKKFILLIIMMIPIIMMSQTQVPAGPVSGTWNLSGSPYMVNGEINIEDTATLVIEPGVEVRFTGWYKFIINGSLMAEGTEAANILFTADDSNEHWYGLRFIESDETSVLDYCIVEYGETILTTGIGVFPENAGGGILVSMCPDTSISIKNSIIRNNKARDGGGILIDESTITLENCEISSNSAVNAGGGIYIIFNSSLTMTNSTIANNSAENEGGGIICLVQGSLELINNTFIHNTSYSNGGGLCIYDPLSFIVKQNIIAHNSAEDGGGIYLDDAYNLGSLSDNTIAYNEATINGGGVFCVGNTTHSFESNIIYFNQVNGINNQIFLSGNSIPIISFCNIQDSTAGFSGAGAASVSLTDCVYGNPLFSDPLNGDFSLTWDNYPYPDGTKSSCIDAGCPGLLEPDGTCNDIGAYSFFQQLDVPVMLQNTFVNDDSFLAEWTECYGALGYYLDVALDDGFTNMVYEGIEIVGDTSYMVEGLDYGTQHYYRVNAFNSALTSAYSNTQSVSTLGTSIDEQDLIDKIAIYPNPFTTSTTFEYTLEKPSDVHFTLYNLQGQIVFVIQERQDKGSQKVQWNIEGLPAGTYYYRIQAGENVGVGKLVKME